MASGKQYSRQELQEILEVALRKQAQPGDYGRDELLETARELGLSPEQVAAAETEVAERRELQALADQEKAKARRGLANHLQAFVLINAGLFAVNVLVGAPWWFQWPLLAWGLGAVAHLLALARTGDEVWLARAEEQRTLARRKAERQQAKRRLEQRVVELLAPHTAKKSDGERALDQAVDEAVDRALGMAAQVLQRISRPKDPRPPGDRH
ncbi:MAG: 2TM domain-containing protein [Deltaproteobacteria bacterium]|nr:2TM domain-containing protein [Deltaproteobacteria bacterium]